MRYLITGLLFFSFCPAWPLLAVANDSPLHPFIAEYDASAKGFSIGVAVKKLVRQKNGEFVYSITPHISGFMRLIVRDNVKMRSRLGIKNSQVIPHSYHYQQTGGDTEKDIRITFKNDQACSVTSNQCWHPKAEQKPLLDPLSVDIAFPLSLQQSLHNDHYHVVTGEKAQVQETQFTIEGHEDIDVPAGHFKTIKVLMKESGKERPTRLWLAKEIQYLPIKIIQYRKKYRISFELSSYSEDPSEINLRPPLETNHS
jgi:hypothetical protein